MFATAVAAAVVGGVDYTASKKRCNDVLFRAGSEALRSAGRQTADFAQVAVVELISVMYSHHTELGKGADLRWREIALQGQEPGICLSHMSNNAHFRTGVATNNESGRTKREEE